MAAAQNMHLIAIDEEDTDIDKRAVGRVVWWGLDGNVNRDALVRALADVGSPAVPPETPSAVVAVHRAVEAVSKAIKGKAHQIKRGDWAIVGKRPEETGEVVTRDAKLTYNVQITASVDGENLTVEGDEAGAVRLAFDAARASLAPTDIGGWLCDKLTELGAIPLRERGGVYFVPRDAVDKFDKVAAAVRRVSQHKIHTMPSMKSADAVEAVLSAIERDTLMACEEIEIEVRDGTLGTRGLKSRSETALARLDLVKRYETILGVNLDKLRESVTAVQGAIASATLALAAADAE